MTRSQHRSGMRVFAIRELHGFSLLQGDRSVLFISGVVRRAFGSTPSGGTELPGKRFSQQKLLPRVHGVTDFAKQR